MPLAQRAFSALELLLDGTLCRQAGSSKCHVTTVLQVLLLDELTTFLDGEDQKGVLEAVRNCVGGPDEVRRLAFSSMITLAWCFPKHTVKLPHWSIGILAESSTAAADARQL